MDNRCVWTKNGSRCTLPNNNKSEYCYTHYPMVMEGHTHDDITAVSTAAEVKEQWKEKLDAELEKVGLGRNSKKKNKNKRIDKQLGGFKSSIWNASDFPRIVEGIFFSSIEEYSEFVTGTSSAEMEGTDQQHNQSKGSSAYGRTYRTGDSAKYKQDNWWEYGDSYYSSSGSNYKTTYVSRKLERGTYTKLDKIQHMHYAVLRDKAGKYFAVWASMDDPEKFDFMMCEVLKMELPLGVTETKYGRFHTSSPKTDFSDADGMFSKGGESFYNIRTRIGRVTDKNWIPPNLRMCAYEGAWQLIPDEWYSRCKAWADKGYTGWYGTWHKGKSDDRMAATVKGKAERPSLKDRVAGYLSKGTGYRSVLYTPPPSNTPPMHGDTDTGNYIRTQEFLRHNKIPSQGVHTQFRPVTREVAVKGQTGCQVIGPMNSVCGDPIGTGKYCAWHNDLEYAGAKLETVSDALDKEHAKRLTTPIVTVGPPTEDLVGCRMRKWNGVPCGEPVVTPPYCAEHNKHVFGYPNPAKALPQA